MSLKSKLFGPSKAEFFMDIILQQHRLLMTFHRGGVLLLDHERALAKAEVDAKQAEADRARAEADKIRFELHGKKEPGDPPGPKFGVTGHERVRIG